MLQATVAEVLLSQKKKKQSNIYLIKCSLSVYANIVSFARTAKKLLSSNECLIQYKTKTVIISGFCSALTDK